MQILLISAIKNKYRNFISRFASADGWARLKLIWFALWYVFLLPFTGLIIIILAVILKAISLIFKVGIVHIGELRSERIGHLAEEIDIFLRRRAMEGQSGPGLHIMTCGKVANRQLLTMAKRQMHILDHPLFLHLYKTARTYTNNSKIWFDLQVDLFKTSQEFNQVPPQLTFTTEEKIKGKEGLSRMGIKPGNVFVCFHPRDRAYLDKLHAYHSRGQWAYHDYRDADVRNYLPAAEYLASLGMFAVRVGYIVERSIKTSNPRIIDYSTHYRSDFMDIYLFANCKFLLESTSGPICVARAFDVPVAAANWIPIKEALLCKHDIFIPMKLWNIERKRFLTFREIITSDIQDFVRTEQYAKAGIETVENTADEILALAKEMNARLDNSWVTTEEDEELQERYNSLFPPDYYPCKVLSRIGAEFLRQNRELLE